MNQFSVWIQPSENACGVRVDSLENAEWLLNRLSQSFVFKSSEPMNKVDYFPNCTFRVPYSSQISCGRFAKLLGVIPEVKLMLDSQ
ncbi:MAG TPA: hypothetical protein VIH42_04595 [Thermoguttaceae bacterium]